MKKLRKLLLVMALVLIIAPATILFAACGITSDEGNGVEPTFYTVTFLNEGEVIKEVMVKKNGDVTAPSTNPTKEGYVFTGWSVPFDEITSDLTIEAVFEEIEGEFSIYGEWFLETIWEEGEEFTFEEVLNGELSGDLTMQVEEHVNGVHVLHSGEWVVFSKVADGYQFSLEMEGLGLIESKLKLNENNQFILTAFILVEDEETGEVEESILSEYTYNKNVKPWYTIEYIGADTSRMEESEFLDENGFLDTEKYQIIKSTNYKFEDNFESHRDAEYYNFNIFGYRFLGWIPTIEMENGVLSKIIYTAKYELSNMKVSITDMQGNHITFDSIIYGEFINPEDLPEGISLEGKEGYIFLGWEYYGYNDPTLITVDHLSEIQVWDDIKISPRFELVPEYWITKEFHWVGDWMYADGTFSEAIGESHDINCSGAQEHGYWEIEIDAEEKIKLTIMNLKWEILYQEYIEMVDNMFIFEANGKSYNITVSFYQPNIDSSDYERRLRFTDEENDMFLEFVDYYLYN